MNKLEIKHLAPYLPYGVKFMSEMDKPFDEFGINPTWTLDGVNKLFGDYCLLTKENNDAYAIQTCKLLLRPLSDLTKEIKVNGETFVPIDVLFPNGTIREIKGKYIINKNGHSFVATDLSYKQVKNLFIWHFDVFGLIEQNLAIDLNTIQK